MKRTLSELAELVEGKVTGKAQVEITGVARIEDAKEGDITFVEKKKFLAPAETSRAEALILPENLNSTHKTFISVENPRLAFTLILEIFTPRDELPWGIHPSVIIGKNCQIAKDVTIMAHTVIMDNVKISKGVIIYPLVYIGYNTIIGKNSVIYPNVTIESGTKLGEEDIIHSGAVIGSDGFGYIEHLGRRRKIPQIGTVRLGNRVEIGANTTIDRATTGETVIGDDTKIDNLVQVAHNVTIGPNSVLMGMVGISGSVKIGENCLLAGQVGVADHTSIGNNVIIGAQSGVPPGGIPADSVVLGTPTRPLFETRRVYAALPRLPELLRRVRRLEKKLEGR